MEICGSSQVADQCLATPGLDIWIKSRPYQHSADGGDVHYVSLCGGGMTTRIILADVSGHGASVAELAQSLRNLMRRNINRKSQAKLVEKLNRQFAELGKNYRFATAVVATYLTRGDKLTICNAGHPRPLWYRAGTGEWAPLAELHREAGAGLANLPLGIVDSTTYPEMELALGKGDFILFYTDALTEAAGLDCQALGESGLIERLKALDLADPAKVAGQLLRSMEDYRGGKAAEDDFTFVLLYHNGGSSPHLSIGQKLSVYAKVLGLKSY